ncbi:MAG: 6-phosphofructokinase [Eubacteriales bacterium]|nr:6-phosphofructokinase [Eubacteriales bacterium]
MKGNIVVGQSGGPTAVINASVAGVYRRAKRLGVKKVYGMIHGIEGFLQGRLCDLDEYLGEAVRVELLKRTPSAVLGTCRYKLPEAEGHEEIYEKIFAVMEEYGIECLFYAGGNDSMDTVKQLSNYAREHGREQRFIGIPKTVDNDLPITDHCPGYGSAAKYIAATIKEIVRDNESYGLGKPHVNIVETMGRNTGWLAASAALAKGEDCSGVDAIYLPETVFDPEDFMGKIEDLATKKKSIVVTISEGLSMADGRFACELGNAGSGVDAFGHRRLAGAAITLAQMVEDRTGLKTRGIEFSVLQRAASHIVSLTDVTESYQCGVDAVNAAQEGRTGVMVTLVRSGNHPYRCGTSIHDIHAVANEVRFVPKEWIGEDGCSMKEEFIEYARPLIVGELQPIYVDGLPHHLVIRELMEKHA